VYFTVERFTVLYAGTCKERHQKNNVAAEPVSQWQKPRSSQARLGGSHDMKESSHIEDVSDTEDITSQFRIP